MPLNPPITVSRYRHVTFFYSPRPPFAELHVTGILGYRCSLFRPAAPALHNPLSQACCFLYRQGQFKFTLCVILYKRRSFIAICYDNYLRHKLGDTWHKAIRMNAECQVASSVPFNPTKHAGEMLPKNW